MFPSPSGEGRGSGPCSSLRPAPITWIRSSAPSGGRESAFPPERIPTHFSAHDTACDRWLTALLEMAPDGRQHTCGSLPQRDDKRFPRWPARADTIAGSVLCRGRHKYEQVCLPSMLFQPLTRVEVLKQLLNRKWSLTDRGAMKFPAGMIAWYRRQSFGKPLQLVNAIHVIPQS